jgi:hypothetical protein
VIIDCHVCNARVNAEVIGQRTSYYEAEPPWETYLLACPQCSCTLVGGMYEGDDAGTLQRLWPFMEQDFHGPLPDEVRHSLSEAAVCFKAGAFGAATVMAGRALEAVCRHFGTERTYLGKGIQELREKEIIDSRLATWAGELHKARNLSAHASGERVSKQDARDLLDFVTAICEYVFVLTGKYEAFMARRRSKQEAKLS